MISTVRIATLVTCLTLSACVMQPRVTFEPSSQVTSALALYADGQHEAALAALNALLADQDLSNEDRRRALAGAALVHLKTGEPDSLATAREHVDAFTSLNKGPIAPEFFLLRESLDSAINAAANGQKKQIATNRENARLRKEVQRMEETLTKLRELSLE